MRRMLLGLTQLDGAATIERVETLFNEVDCDLSILRAPPEWNSGRSDASLCGRRSEQSR